MKTLNSLLDVTILTRLLSLRNQFGDRALQPEEYINTLHNMIWKELATGNVTSQYRRNLQKSVVERLLGIVRPAAGGTPVAQQGIVITLTPTVSRNSDAVSFAKGTLRTLQTEIKSALPFYSDVASRYHLQDLLDRIAEGLKTEK